MSLGTEIGTAIMEMQTVLGSSTVVIGGNPYPCSRNSRRNSKAMQPAGYFDDWSIEIVIVGRVLGSASVPEVNDSVTLDGQVCAVVERIFPAVSDGSDAAFYKIQLRDVT